MKASTTLSSADKIIQSLQQQNQTLQYEININCQVAKILAQQSWLNSDLYMSLLDSISKLSMKNDDVHGKPQRLVFAMRLHNLSTNLNTLAQLLPYFLREYQENYMRNQLNRNWISFQWYVRSHHYHTGLDKMAHDRDQRWLSSLCGEQGIIVQMMRKSLLKWVQQPLIPFPFEDIFSETITEMNTKVKNITKLYPKELLYKDSYETYLLAFYKCLRYLDSLENLCDRQFNENDSQQWFHDFYLKVYRGVGNQKPVLNESQLNATYADWRAA